MKSTYRVVLAVILAVAAFCVLALPAVAGCPDDDPDCRLVPPESRQIRVSSAQGDLALSEVERSNPLAPLPMPPPALLQLAAPIIESSALPPEFTSIALPLRTQDPLDVSCGVQALGMALDGIKGSAPTSNAILGFLQDQGMMYDFGTGVEELALAAQSFGYAGSVSFHNWTLDDLRAELAAGRPVVLDLGANGPDEPGHFVTLTGFSPDGRWVSYNDPLLGKRVVPLEVFRGLWALQGYSGVSVFEAPPAPSSPNYAPWTALAAAMMATLALAPSMLQDQRRLGVGGLLIADPGAGSAATYIGFVPPYQAPAGMKWIKGAPAYETQTRSETVYHQIPKKKLQKVQVGTTTVKIPYTKRILVDNGRWVTDYKTERYVKGYRSKRILDGYRTKRYVKYYRTKLYRNRWGGYSRRRTPVYGYKRVPVYRTMRVPVYGTRKVPNGRHWESKWEYEQHTKYKTVIKPVYKDQWVTVGYERIPEEKIIEEQVHVGYQWALVPEPNSPRKPEIDIVDEMGDIHVPMRSPQLMVTTAPLVVRDSPDPKSASLTVALNGAEIIWTGDKKVLKNGAIWYQVRYQDPNKGLITGWVNSVYLKAPVHIPDFSTEEKSSIDTSRTDALRLWVHFFSPEERAAYIAAEKQRLKAFWSEIRKLTIPQGGLAGGVIEGIFIREEVDSLLKPPQWYINGGMPDPFYKEHLLDEETLRVLQLILLNPGSLSAKVTERTWDIVSDALHINKADLKTHVFGNAFWGAESTMSVGSFPIELLVIRQHGHYLLRYPSPGSGNVSEKFLGVPNGEKVTWDGTYKLGEDSAGDEVVYYLVSWVFNRTTYRGWIPSKYLAPEVEHWDPSGGIPGGFDHPTFGFGDKVDGWLKYHTYGEAQFLNIKAILLEIGLSEEEIPDYLSRHTNLCGPLAVMEYLNVSLEEGFRRWIECSGTMKAALLSGDTTSSANLKEFFEAFDIKVEQRRDEKPLITASDARQPIVALVAINRDGSLSPEGQTAHWIRITEAKKDGMVKYYNPYTNCYEDVSWETFDQSWDRASETPGNAGVDRIFITIATD